jgi:hypothetical protein
LTASRTARLSRRICFTHVASTQGSVFLCCPFALQKLCFSPFSRGPACRTRETGKLFSLRSSAWVSRRRRTRQVGNSVEGVRRRRPKPTVSEETGETTLCCNWNTHCRTRGVLSHAHRVEAIMGDHPAGKRKASSIAGGRIPTPRPTCTLPELPQGRQIGRRPVSAGR